MSGKSRLRTVAIGCGSIMAIFFFLGIAATLAITLDKMEPVNVSSIAFEESISGGNVEAQAGMPNTVSGKALRLKVDTRFAKLTLKRGEQLGKVLVNGEFDQANFELETKVTEHDDRVDYTVDFSSKLNTLAMIWQAVAAEHRGEKVEFNDNHLEIILPADMPVELNFDVAMGESTLDLTGLAVKSIKGEASKGELKVFMREPNPVVMETLDFTGSTGNLNWHDIQNYNFSKGRFEGSMGQLELLASGPFKQDTEIDLDFSMGELKVVGGQDTNLVNNVKVTLGDQSRRTTAETVPGNPTLTVGGRLAMGELRIYTFDDPQVKIEQIFNIAYSHDVDAVIAEVRALHSANPKELGPGSLNTLGYRFMDRDTIEESIAYLKLNVELFPDYINGYDSLGEAYYTAGDLETALIHYQKALELDPGYSSSVRMVQRIKEKLNMEVKEGEENTKAI